MADLRIHLFGRFRVTFDGDASEVRLTRTAQILLAYLLLQHSFSSRDVLATLCWGDQPDEQARNCLNTALWRLRRALGGDCAPGEGYVITAPSGEVGFNWGRDHWLDVEVFERASQQLLGRPLESLPAARVSQLEQVLTLYTGDLLEGFYDDWALRERERVRAMYLDSLSRLMAYHRARGAYAEGIAAGQRILVLDPLREEVHRELMRLYLAASERASAVRQYHTCRAVLAAELNIPPMAETEALYHEILATDAAQVLAPEVQVRPAMSDALLGLQKAIRQMEHAQAQLARAMALVERLSGQAQT
ncbi:MAG: response regulator receiver protein [Anaerolineae bacterium]|nr:response regulator receiver protein [Anaerolineae bacterium]